MAFWPWVAGIYNLISKVQMGGGGGGENVEALN